MEPLIAIPIFIHDFLFIHHFNDGNERMSRLLTTLLLYRSGFYVEKYISLEALIAQTKQHIMNLLERQDTIGMKKKEDVLPFMKYLLGTILAAYKAFEERFTNIEEKLPALELVRKATQQKLGRFTKQGILELCSSLSISSV